MLMIFFVSRMKNPSSSILRLLGVPLYSPIQFAVLFRLYMCSAPSLQIMGITSNSPPVPKYSKIGRSSSGAILIDGAFVLFSKIAGRTTFSSFVGVIVVCLFDFGTYITYISEILFPTAMQYSFSFASAISTLSPYTLTSHAKSPFAFLEIFMLDCSSLDSSVVVPLGLVVTFFNLNHLTNVFHF